MLKFLARYCKLIIHDVHACLFFSLFETLSTPMPFAIVHQVTLVAIVQTKHMHGPKILNKLEPTIFIIAACVLGVMANLWLQIYFLLNEFK